MEITYCVDKYNSKSTINLKHIENVLLTKSIENCRTEVQKVPKLRAYVKFKNSFFSEPYLFTSISKQNLDAALYRYE